MKLNRCGKTKMNNKNRTIFIAVSIYFPIARQITHDRCVDYGLYSMNQYPSRTYEYMHSLLYHEYKFLSD